MLLLGLTGSIATGKSTGSSILRAPPYSLPIIDADVIARQVVEPGTPGYNKIVAHFASTTPDLLLDAEEPRKGNAPLKGRPLNRPALGRRVFGDSEERKKDRAVLNSIVHPAVRMAMYRQLLAHYLHGSWVVILDVPLLFESGLDILCGVVMVVAVSDPAIQMARLRARDPHLSEEDARNRVASQGDVMGKVRRCEARGPGRGVVVWNDKGIEELREEVGRVITGIQSRSPRWWAWLLLLCPPAAGLVGLWTLYRNWRIARRWKEQELRERAKL
jgi:dephospho-CoA kinase